MGQLIVSAQMTADSVMDHMEDWLDPELESEQDGVEQLRAADALILGRNLRRPRRLLAEPGGHARRARQPDPEIRCLTHDQGAAHLELATPRNRPGR